MKDNTNRVFHNAKVEINRILSALDIPKSFQELILTNFKRVHSEFKPSTKYRSVEKLVPVVLYYSLRDQNVPINIHKLLEVYKIEKSEFNHFRMQVRRYIKTRDSIKRQLFISQKLLEVRDHFNLGMEFVFHAKKIMCRLWELIKNTTDNVIAGVSASITMLCYYNNQMSINAICKLLGIRMSTIQFQVEHRIFEKLRVEGFITLKKSINIIKTVMEQLGLFEKEEAGVHVDTMVMVELGNAVQIINRELDVNYYRFGLLAINKEKIILEIKVYDSVLQTDTPVESQPQRLFDLELCKYSHGKGPPNLSNA